MYTTGKFTVSRKTDVITLYTVNITDFTQVSHRTLVEWCTEKFGPCGNIWKKEVPRWFDSHSCFFFTNQEDREVFILSHLL